MRSHSRVALACAFGLAVAVAPAAPLGAGQTVVAGPQYAGGALHRWIFGENWRDLWLTPIEVPQLDLAATAGGLRPVKEVGRLQTLGLAFAGADGRSYTFRSVDKHLERVLPAWLRWGPAARAVRDQGSAGFPGATLVLDRLSRSQGLHHPRVRLVVMPDDPALGRFRERFAGRLGTFLEYPQPGENGSPGTFGATEIVSSEELWRRWRAGAPGTVDARAFLRARLLDWWVADWDRHPGQWRWARIPGFEGWQPIPQDHDNAFASYEGLIFHVVRLFAPQLVRFTDVPQMDPLTRNSRWLDAWLLASLDRREWLAELDAFAARADAAALDAAIAALPEPWRSKRGRELRVRLVARLEALPQRALAEYRELARAPHLHGSDADERVVLECSAQGVDLTVKSAAGGASQRRHFRSSETRAVGVVLYGGDDALVRRGAEPCPVEVRICGRGRERLERGVPARRCQAAGSTVRTGPAGAGPHAPADPRRVSYGARAGGRR